MKLQMSGALATRHTEPLTHAQTPFQTASRHPGKGITIRPIDWRGLGSRGLLVRA